MIRTYADAGKSGLRIDGREALQRLLRDVESGQADFNVILVYDVNLQGQYKSIEHSYGQDVLNLVLSTSSRRPERTACMRASRTCA